MLARVGLIRPLALADGAASGRPDAASSACIAGWAGTRSAMRRQAGGDEAGDAGIRRAAARPASAAPANAPRPARAPASSNTPIALGRCEVGDMDDQRVEARPALGRVDPRDRLGIGGVGGEAVDGLGRHRDRLPARISRAASAIASSLERQDAGVGWQRHGPPL